MPDGRHLDEQQILEISRKAVHKKFSDLGYYETTNYNKCGLGGFAEEKIFGHKWNSDKIPDFIGAGIELKVTPVKNTNDWSLSSKEILVLNMINYKTEALESFKTSSFYRKNKKFLILV